MLSRAPGCLLQLNHFRHPVVVVQGWWRSAVRLTDDCQRINSLVLTSVLHTCNHPSATPWQIAWQMRNKVLPLREFENQCLHVPCFADGCEAHSAGSSHTTSISDTRGIGLRSHWQLPPSK